MPWRRNDISAQIWIAGMMSKYLCQTRKDAVYRQISNISRTLVDNKNVGHSDAVGASPVGAAPTTSSFCA